MPMQPTARHERRSNMSDRFFDRLWRWLQDHSPEVFVWLFRVVVLVCLLSLFFAVCGCKPKQLATTTTNQQTSLISERYDSAHTVAGDSATAALLLRCDSMGNVYLANLVTEQGRRLRLELQLRNVQAELANALNAKKGSNSEIPNLSSSTPKQNTPLLLNIDCKEDSFEVVIRGLRERIAYYEENKQLQEVPVRYIPDFYKNCTRGFWALLVVLLVAVALLVWKNWAKIAAWVIKIYARIKL